MDEIFTSRSRSTSVIEKNAISVFLEKLFVILEDESIQDIISWQSDGNSFIIKKPTDLEEIVLPKYFKHNNIQSFVRQLNMYSFSKTRHDSNFREFKQPKFMKGRRDLLHLIKRKQSFPTPTVIEKKKKKNEYDDNKLYNANQPILSTTSSTTSSFFGSPFSKNIEIHDKYELNNNNKEAGGEILELHEKVTILEYKLFNLNKKYEILDYKHSSICKLISNISNEDTSIISLKLKLNEILNDANINQTDWIETNNNSIKRDRKMSHSSENTDSDDYSEADISNDSIKKHNKSLTIDTKMNNKVIKLENHSILKKLNNINEYCFPSSSNSLVRMNSMDSYDSKIGLHAITTAAISLQNNTTTSNPNPNLISNKVNLFSYVDRYILININ